MLHPFILPTLISLFLVLLYGLIPRVRIAVMARIRFLGIRRCHTQRVHFVDDNVLAVIYSALTRRGHYFLE